MEVLASQIYVINNLKCNSLEKVSQTHTLHMPTTEYKCFNSQLQLLIYGIHFLQCVVIIYSTSQNLANNLQQNIALFHVILVLTHLKA